MQAAMATQQEYRMRAKECIELALTARTQEQRIMLQHIAETWVRLADEAAAAMGSYSMLSRSVHAKA
jgi:hypothetical protein